MRKTIAAVAMLLGLAFSGATASEAAQVTAPPPPDTVKIVPAAVTIVYNARIHGPRCRYQARGCGYYYGGWWYARPWWRVGPVYVGPPMGYWVYNPYRHGRRCHYRGPHCGYYYHGWWYARPFWTFRLNIH